MHAVAAVYYSYKIQQGLLVLIKEAYKPLLSNTAYGLQYSILWKCIQLVFKPNLPVSDPWGWRGCQLFKPVQVPQKPNLPVSDPWGWRGCQLFEPVQVPQNPKLYPFQIPGDGGDASSLKPAKVHQKPLYL